MPTSLHSLGYKPSEWYHNKVTIGVKETNSGLLSFTVPVLLGNLLVKKL